MYEQKSGFFNKMNGAWFGFLALAVGSVFFAVTLVLYYIAEPGYSLFTNFISNLTVGPNQSDVFFFLFLILLPVLLVPFCYDLSKQFQKQGAPLSLARLAFIFFVLYALAQILMAFFPFNRLDHTVYSLHMILAVLLFFFFGVCALLCTIIEFSLRSIPAYLSITSLITAVLVLVVSLLILLVFLTGINDYNVIVSLIEWMYLGAFFIWLLLHAFYLSGKK
jgi:hypothetical membrane protein